MRLNHSLHLLVLGGIVLFDISITIANLPSFIRKMFIGGLNWETTDRMYLCKNCIPCSIEGVGS